MSLTDVVSPHETNKLNVKHLKRFWSKSILKKEGKLSADDFINEWKTDKTLLAVMGLGLEQTIQYVYQEAPSFEAFEDWILTVSGDPDQEKVNQFNALFSTDRTVEAAPVEYKLLTQADWDFWQQNGYIIIRNAISKEHCDETINELCDFIGVDRNDRGTWYNHHHARQGIMVQLFQHPVLERNRKADKIKKAFEELWNRTDLWVNTDRVGFNPPETESYKFQGPRLHWDASIVPPIQFGTQGILYLSDTAENQGAFTLVPGFNNRIEDWLKSLPPESDPYREDLYALGSKPIAANAGDFIIWHHILPHGSSPNTAALPRFVQYINYAPADEDRSGSW
ncbi:phytanoyl-CoA dioxygenase family protein [Mucilaginibacter sp. E4BP6]|uniref:phytanoyl-CoA dioxygenase family protein n=1 Tax=Mucilaginibacter sp. E4BP6 TaxID=2723089 RepID=UPI0015CA4BF9|nr:phytanoyl-CoA dioxygenase family protein [Mucilaginibacter sp. E4BP6]NYE66201.1 hypothetical protein [Mucilaginibacter sp. E4BP6]